MIYIDGAYKRSPVWGELAEVEEDIVIRKAPTKDIITDLHSSILPHVFTHLPWRDFINLVQVHKYTKSIITPLMIVTCMVADIGLMAALCRCIYNSNIEYLSCLLDNFMGGMQMNQVSQALVYAIYTHRNEVAYAMIRKIIIGRTHYNWVYEFEHPFTCGYLECFESFVVEYGSNLYDATVYTLLQAACAVDNVEMFEYIMQWYNIEFGHFDIWQAITNNSRNVFLRMLQMRPQMKLSQRLLKTIFRGNYMINWDLLDYAVSQGNLHISKKLAHDIFMYSTHVISDICECVCYVKEIVKFMDKHGRQKDIQKWFNLLLFAQHRNHKMLLYLYNKSKRLVITAKHMRMLEDTVTHTVPRLEYMFLNRIQMQNRAS